MIIKIFLSLFLFALVTAPTHADLLEEIIEWEMMNAEEVEEYVQKLNIKERSSDLTHLLLAKKAIISGDPALADRYLDRVPKNNATLSKVRNRYKAIIHFIKDDYEAAHQLLKEVDLYNPNNFKEVCLLKTYIMMALSKRNKSLISESISLNQEKELLFELNICKNYTMANTTNDHIWLNNLELMQRGKLDQIRGAYASDIGFIINNPEIIRPWLKTALYLGREDLVLKNVGDFPLFIYQDKTAREIMAFIYYRLGDTKKAEIFIDDILTPNSESIRGNIKLENQEYELAYGHFKLALNKKENSSNALERAIPLAWLLGLWNDGPELLTRLVGPEHDFKKRKTLEVAFKTRLDEIEKAYQEIIGLTKDYRDYPVFEVDLLKSYLSLRMKDQRNLADASERSCRRYEGLNCWIQMQSLIWDNLPQMINREDQITLPKGWNIDELKSSRTYESLAEETLINQRDIEELDSNTVQLLGN